MREIHANHRAADNYYLSLDETPMGTKISILYYGTLCAKHDTNLKTLSSKGCYLCNKERKTKPPRRVSMKQADVWVFPPVKLTWPVPSLGMGGGRP